MTRMEWRATLANAGFDLSQIERASPAPPGSRRMAIIKLAKAWRPDRDIARELGVSHSYVRKTVSLWRSLGHQVPYSIQRRLKAGMSS